MVNDMFIRLKIVLVSVQNRCTICAEYIIGLETILDVPIVLLGEEAQVEAQFGPFGDSANLDARWVYGLCGTYHTLGNQFGRI